jgi:hypothetical protein
LSLLRCGGLCGTAAAPNLGGGGDTVTNDNNLTTHGEWIARGKRIFESGKYAPQRGKLLGRIQAWGLDVYENSPQSLIDALFAEQEHTERSHDGAV